MTAPEQVVIERLVERIERLLQSAAIDRELFGAAPDTAAAFDAMPPARQSASRALLKSFEQIEDQLARAFRAVPVVAGIDTTRWFARDHADFMERVGVIERAADWSRIVKLRNQLAHDYPLDPELQIGRLREAIGYLPMLAETHRRLAAFVREDLPGMIL